MRVVVRMHVDVLFELIVKAKNEDVREYAGSYWSGEEAKCACMRMCK